LDLLEVLTLNRYSNLKLIIKKWGSNPLLFIIFTKTI
jgi:hypothetical protein